MLLDDDVLVYIYNMLFIVLGVKMNFYVILLWRIFYIGKLILIIV